MRYVVTFEYEPDPECEIEFKDGLEIRSIEGPDCSYNIKNGILRSYPSRRPSSDYRYNTYQEGYDKGVNDTIDKLEGKNGEYDPTVDKRDYSN